LTNTDIPIGGMVNAGAAGVITSLSGDGAYNVHSIGNVNELVV
jgi:hypothetical protein